LDVEAGSAFDGFGLRGGWMTPPIFPSPIPAAIATRLSLIISPARDE